MKTIRKVTSFALVMAILFSGMSFIQAASQEAKNLNTLGLLLNVTDEELSQPLDRVIGITMVLKALGYKDADVAGKAGDNPFADMDKHSWAKGYAAVAYENGITTGITNEGNKRMFGPALGLSKKQMLTFMLRVLGYDAATAWNNTESLARQAGILTDNSENDTNFTKDDAARIMYQAMSAKLVGREGRLIDRLIEKGKVEKAKAVSLGLVAPELPKNFAVTGVEATNLRQIKVTFNREVNVESAKRLSAYTLKGDTGVSTRSLSEVTISEGGKEVLLTVGPALSHNPNPSVLEVNKGYNLTIKDIKDVNGQGLDSGESHHFQAQDGKQPEIMGLEFTGPRNAKIIFSEPIKTLGKISISQDRSNFSVRKLEIDPAMANVVKFEANSNFRQGVTYKFEISEMKDFANYPNIIYTEEKTYEAESNTPTASVVGADQGKVEVVFDRPVRGLTNKHFYHTFPHQTAKEIYKDSGLKNKVTTGEYVSKVWVVFATGITSGNYPLPRQAEFHIISKVGPNQIQDHWGNKLADFVQVLDVTADNMAPEVDSIDVQSETQIVITYNKDLSTAGTYKIVNTSGKTLANPTASLSGKQVTLRFSRIKEKSAILEIRGVKDNTLSRNEMSTESRSIEFTDKVFDGVISADFKANMDGSKIVGGQIYANYNEEVASNALVAKNYRISFSGKEEGLNSQSFSFGDSNKTIVISLDEAMAKKVADNLGNTRLVVGGEVTDLAGNVTTGFSKSVPVTGVVAATMTKAVLVKEEGTSLVEIHFNRGIANILKADGITVQNHPDMAYKGSERLTSNDTRVEEINIKGDDNRVIEVRLSRSIYSPRGLRLSVSGNSLEDVLGAKLSGFTVDTIEDKVGPMVATKDDKPLVSAVKDGASYYIEVTYTEEINSHSLASGTYEINGTDDFTISNRPMVDGIHPNLVRIQVTPKASADYSVDFTLSQVGAIQDMAGNRLNGTTSSLDVVRTDTWK